MNDDTGTRRSGRSRMRYLGAVARAGVTLGLGCQSQADPSYRGEPLLSVTAHVEAALRAGPVDVGLLWVTLSGVFDLTCSGGVETVSGAPSAWVAACGEVPCGNLQSRVNCCESM